MRSKALNRTAGCVLPGPGTRSTRHACSIDLRFARKDAEAVLRAHKVLAQWMERTGTGSVEFRQPEEETVDAILEIAAHGTHQIGTARMATSPDKGVVDANLKAFGIDNLYVASSAVFPTSGQCNPTLSIAAFSMRLAAHLCVPSDAPAPRRDAGKTQRIETDHAELA